MLIPLLSVLSSSNHAADDGGTDHEEGADCPSHGIPTRGAPCPACLEAATKLVALPIASAPAEIAPVPISTRPNGPNEAVRLWLALGPPTGGHQDLGLYD